MALPSNTLERVYVGELPVRLYRGVNALCIVALVGTGIIIGRLARPGSPNVK